VERAPGFFGKLPSHGDFVGRRLPLGVRDCFDRWLQAGLVRSREELGDEWLPVWLSSPLWRFVVAVGVCGEQAWAGVMMPSHDRVGRCFPLLVMVGIDGTPSLRDCLTVHDAWFARLEELALSTLEANFALDTFDSALITLAGAASWRSADANMPFETPGCAWVAMRVDGKLPTLADAGLVRQSAWWTDGSAQLAPCLAVCAGLPVPAVYAALLHGRWNEYACSDS
jgi:type VI secretion system protein ImpM